MGVSIDFFHTEPSPEPLSMLSVESKPPQQRIRLDLLGFQSNKKRWTARDGAGKRLGLETGQMEKMTSSGTI